MRYIPALLLLIRCTHQQPIPLTISERIEVLRRGTVVSCFERKAGEWHPCQKPRKVKK